MKQSSAIPIILLKTPSKPTDAYLTYFTSNRFCPSFLPVLEHNFVLPALSELRTLLCSPPPHPFSSRYGGIICTSQRAVEALAYVLRDIANQDEPTQDEGNHSQHEEGSKERRLEVMGSSRGKLENGSNISEVNGNWPGAIAALRYLQLPLYTVGPATSRALSNLAANYLPHCSVLGQETGNGANLAELILQHYPFAGFIATGETEENVTERDRKAPGLPLLFLVGETRRDIIPLRLNDPDLPEWQRVRVDEMVVYASGVLPAFSDNLNRILMDLIPTFESAQQPNQESKTESETNLPSKDQSGQTLLTNRLASTTLGVDRKIDPMQEKHDQHVTTPINVHAPARPQTLWFVVFSPAAMKELVTAVDYFRVKYPDGPRICVASIGPTTRDILASEHNFRVDVCAANPSPEGVGEGIEAFMQAQATV